MPDLIAEFQRLADAGAGSASEQTTLLLDALSPALARRLRLCAIPHQFDAQLLMVLAPEIGEEEAQVFCDELAKLAVVTAAGDHWSIHDRVRTEIWAWWLELNNRQTFTQASGRLAEYFLHEAETLEGPERETSQRRYMYHLLAADTTRGYEEFQRLLRKARHELRFAECAALIRLASDYRPLFSGEQILWLRYYEGKLAMDQRDWSRAREIFDELIGAEGAPPALATAVRLRLGQLAGELRDWASAVPVLQQALAISAEHGSPSLQARALCELGIAYRELGCYEEAEKTFSASIEQARKQAAWASLATAFDSVGLLYLRQQKPREAMNAFGESLSYLEKQNDVFRSADVYDHLGVACAELGEWAASERYHEQSLRITEQAGDNLGRAAVLNNIARVRARQGKLAEAIDAVKEAMQIFAGLNDAYCAAQAQQNLGKYMLRAGEREAARQTLLDAALAFEALKKNVEADNVRRDIANLDDRGLPWWVWTSLAIGVLLLLFIVLVTVAGE